ncbi:hypothetical protein PENTCL1PPCAC_30875, partial [Pristionchus entomophagus]
AVRRRFPSDQTKTMAKICGSLLPLIGGIIQKLETTVKAHQDLLNRNNLLDKEVDRLRALNQELEITAVEVFDENKELKRKIAMTTE